MEVIFRKEGAVAHVSINREKAHNALNSNVMAMVEKIFQQIEEDGEIMVVVIRGVGEKAFVAGADLKEIKDAGKGRPELIRKGQGIFTKIRNSSKVVIAAVNGFALGGGLELALACDIRIAAENAKFALPEAKLGLMPGYGGTQLLPRLVGIGRAKYLVLSGKMISADEAFRLGLVEKVCSSERLMEEVAELAKNIAANGPLSIRACKRAIDAGMQLPLPNALELELEEYAKVALSGDAEEGMAAFLEKRPADFQGR